MYYKTNETEWSLRGMSKTKKLELLKRSIQLRETKELPPSLRTTYWYGEGYVYEPTVGRCHGLKTPKMLKYALDST